MVHGLWASMYNVEEKLTPRRFLYRECNIVSLQEWYVRLRFRETQPRKILRFDDENQPLDSPLRLMYRSFCPQHVNETATISPTPITHHF